MFFRFFLFCFFEHREGTMFLPCAFSHFLTSPPSSLFPSSGTQRNFNDIIFPSFCDTFMESPVSGPLMAVVCME